MDIRAPAIFNIYDIDPIIRPCIRQFSKFLRMRYLLILQMQHLLQEIEGHLEQMTNVTEEREFAIQFYLQNYFQLEECGLIYNDINYRVRVFIMCARENVFPVFLRYCHFQFIEIYSRMDTYERKALAFNECCAQWQARFGTLHDHSEVQQVNKT